MQMTTMGCKLKVRQSPGLVLVSPISIFEIEKLMINEINSDNNKL